ncbi:MAG: FMN-binding protein [Chloroflexota bacterium]
MSNLQSGSNSKMNRAVKRIGLSAFLAASVVGYSLYERSGAGGLSSASAANNTTAGQAGATTTPTPETTATPTNDGLYQNGDYTGDSDSASHWGQVQVEAVVENGAITDIKILDYPASTRLSVRISQVALPYLIDEAIKAQSATVDTISGATFTSEAFRQSLQSALDNAATGAATSTPTATSTGSQL